MTALDDLRVAFAGRYLVEHELGEGGSAAVYSARDVKHDRKVAIKVLKPEVAQSIGSERFLREIRVDAALQHPRILPLFDSGEVLGTPFFVMPMVEGMTLRDRLDRERQLPVAEAVRITTQLADALGYAHSKGFVHRDVKPENALLAGENVWLADFGIARALREATTERVTVTGIALGTPAYMSPEQRVPDAPLDGRADQYSLACVLYEMLVGRPPSMSSPPGRRGGPFTPVRTLRNDVPRAIDTALTTALAFDPEDRWPNMEAFSTALTRAAVATPISRHEIRQLTRRGWVRTAVGAALVAAAGIGYWLSREDLPPIDAEMLAVLPLAHEGDSSGVVLDGDDCSRLLRDALARWTGLRHADDMRLRDIRRRFGRPETLNQAMRMARELGAGLAVWGVVEPRVSPSSRARTILVHLYDVNRRTSTRDAQAVISPDSNVTAIFQALADSLLYGRAAAGRPTVVATSRDFPAVQAYVDGHRALDSWDLPRASAAFRRAAERDPTFGLANLWLAQVTSWTGNARNADWGAPASRALQLGEGLSSRDSTLASALIALSAYKNAAACDDYRTLLQRDRRDFTAWFGLGQCLSTDATVERDPQSRSGFRFRTSMEEATNAFETAITLVPSFPNAFGQGALQRLGRLLYAETGIFRGGLNPADSTRFAAWPEVIGDTLGFVPFRDRAVFAESAGTTPPTLQLALQRNRDRLLGVVTRWVAADSNNVLALETLALTREANDELASLRRAPAGPGETGVEALRRARRLASGEAATRLAAIDVRFRLKLEQFAEARALADSLLSAALPDSTTPVTAGWLQGLAMLTGRAAQAATWGRRASAFELEDVLLPGMSLPTGVATAGAEVMTWAALGVAPDSIRGALARLQVALRSVPAPLLELTQIVLIEQPLTYAWPVLGPATPPAWRVGSGNLLFQAQLALGRGDSSAARRIVAQVDSNAVRGGADQASFNAIEAAARLSLALGDSAGATRFLDRSLTAVRTSGRQLLFFPEAGAGYVRAMILRSALAAASGDTARARTWGTRAVTLWRDADPLVQPAMAPIARWRQ